jgi:glutamate carboxypeptidase
LATEGDGVAEEQAAVVQHFVVLRGVLGDDTTACAHRFDECGMSSADFGCLDVGVSVRLELAIAVSIDSAGKPDARIAGGFKLLDVGAGVRCIANDDEFHVRPDSLKSLNHNVCIVLRLEPAHVEKVFLRSNSELIQSSCRFGPFTVRSICDHDGRLLISFQIVVPNHIRISDNRIGNDRRKIFRNSIVQASCQSPLLAETLDTVHVQSYWSRGQAWHHRERGVCRITHEDAVEAERQRMKYREKCVRQRVEMLRSNSWKDGELHSFVRFVTISDVIGAAIDRHIVPARNQSSGQFFGECLKPAVICRNAAGSQDGQFHRVAIIDYARNCRGGHRPPLQKTMPELLSYLNRQLPEALRFLEEMVAMESPSFDKRLVDQFVRFVGSRFAAIGGSVEFVHADKFGDHLVVRFTGRSSDRVLLLGHTDTVWPAGELPKRPFKIDAGRALGPGVFDMKAGILLIWMAIDALQKSGGGLPNSLTVLLVSDEEVGSNSSKALTESEASRSKAVLVLEPSLPGGALKTARKGVGRFTVKAIGRAAHAGIDPEKGVNAIEEISRQILKIQRMTDTARGTTVTVGVVQGGTRSNVVPAEAAAEIDIRVTSMEEAERVTKAIKTLSPELPDARLEIRGSINRPPMERTAETNRLVQLAQKIASSLGMELKEGSTGGASDGNFTSALGIPTLDGLGPVGGGAHAIDEWLDLESLPQRAALLAGLIEQL